MTPSGYSHRSVVEKLGIKVDFTIVLLSAPKNVAELYAPLPDGVRLVHSLKDEVDMIHFFTKDKAELEATFPQLATSIKKNGLVWISWPKGSSKMTTDLNENSIRDIGLANGMVDVKVIAVDADWSGLKFVYRIIDR